MFGEAASKWKQGLIMGKCWAITLDCTHSCTCHKAMISKLESCSVTCLGKDEQISWCRYGRDPLPAPSHLWTLHNWIGLWSERFSFSYITSDISRIQALITWYLSFCSSRTSKPTQKCGDLNFWIIKDPASWLNHVSWCQPQGKAWLLHELVDT